MKKALGILLVLALLLTVFVSCSQEAGLSVAEELASVSFDGSRARALSASRDPFNADNYVWTYTAQKADASGLTNGETATEQRINTGKGLAGKVPGFSQGYWNFTLYAYAAVPGSTEGTFEPTGSALYSGTASHVKVAKGASNVVTVSVSPSTTGTGYIAFDKANLALKALKSGEDINAQGDTRSVNFSYGIYAITDTTFSNNLINEGTAGKTALDAGSYFVRVSYKYAEEDDFVIADEAIVAVVYGGQTTTIKGTIGELSTDVSFGAEEVEIPSAEGDPVAVPENLSEYEDTDAGYEAYQEDAGDDAIEDVELSNGTATTEASVVATVPARAVYSLLQESISEDPNTTSAMSLDLTVDINTQETTASKMAYDVNLIKTVETTTTTTTGTSKSTNASLVKNVAEYVAATIKVGAGLRDVEVYHSGNLMKKTEDISKAGTSDAPTDETEAADAARDYAGFFLYDDENGILYLKTKSFSPFVVTFTPDTIPEESKVVNVTREIGYADLQKAVDAAVAGDTLKLVADIDLSEPVVVMKKLTLDLNEQRIFNSEDLWDEETGAWSLVSVQKGGDLTITGNGTLDAKDYDCYAVDVCDGAKLVIENGTFKGNISAIYAYEGFVTVKGGSFDIVQLSSHSDHRFMLNCYDSSRAEAKAWFTVTGGTFHIFNPADNASEGAGTNYVPEGYESVYDSVNETYSVVKLRVAKVGDVYYTSLKDAFAAAAGNDTVNLLKDVEWNPETTGNQKIGGFAGGKNKITAYPTKLTFEGNSLQVKDVTIVPSIGSGQMPAGGTTLTLTGSIGDYTVENAVLKHFYSTSSGRQSALRINAVNNNITQDAAKNNSTTIKGVSFLSAWGDIVDDFNSIYKQSFSSDPHAEYKKSASMLMRDECGLIYDGFNGVLNISGCTFDIPIAFNVGIDAEPRYGWVNISDSSIDTTSFGTERVDYTVFDNVTFRNDWTNDATITVNAGASYNNNLNYEFKNCSFDVALVFALANGSSVTNDSGVNPTIKFTNCTFNGTLLTQDNYESLMKEYLSFKMTTTLYVAEIGSMTFEDGTLTVVPTRKSK